MKLSDESLDSWKIPEAQFPRRRTTAEKLQFMLNYAVLAPSSHNAQPWRFIVHDEAVELREDRSRALPVVDPRGRELVISCGAALFNLRVALRYFGFEGEVKLLPAPEESGLLARVRLGRPRKKTEMDQSLFRAIPRRHTNREPFAEECLPEVLRAALCEAAQEEGAWLHLATDDEREGLADLIGEAGRLQWAESGFRRELAAWIRPNRTERRDGIPGYARGVSDLKSLADALLVRVRDRGKTVAGRDRARALTAPVLAVLGTEDDMLSDWLRAGQAMQRVLLRATAAGACASFFNQPLEIAELRPQVRAAVVETGFPQLLFRLGYGCEVKPTPRRTVAEVSTNIFAREGK